MHLFFLLYRYSPIGICSLIAGKVASMENISDVLEKLGLYMATVITGLVIHAFIVLPLLYFIFTRRNPFKFILGMRAALLTAFGTSSRYKNYIGAIKYYLMFIKLVKVG